MKRKKRAAKIQRQLELINAAKTANRDLTPEEQAEVDSLQREIDALTVDIDTNGDDEGGGDPPAPDSQRSLGGGQPQPQITTPAPNGDAVRQAVEAERQRINDITTICRDFGVDHQSYIDKGAILEQLRTTSGPIPTGIHVVDSGEDELRWDASDGLLLRGGVQPEQPSDGAAKFSCMTLRDLAIECLERSGIADARRMSNDDLLREICTRQYFNPTAAFPTILDNALQKAYVQGHRTVPVTFDQWTKKGSLMFDRLGRKDDETPFVVEWFVKNGIEVWSAMEGQQRFDNHVDKLLNYIRYWQASGESIKTSVRVKTRISQLTEEGYYTGGIVPYGYRLENRGRTNKRNKAVCDLAIDPDEAEVVKVIFQKYVCEGYGSQRICRYLAEQGFRNRKGGNIPTTSINRIIKNPLYIGILCNGESRSEEVLTDLQIIDVELFERAQNIVQNRAKPRTHREVPLNTKGQSLLVGNVYCGHCGRRLTLATSGRKYNKKDGTVVTKSYARYQCCYNTQHPGECDGPSGYGVTKLDSLMEQIIRIQFERIKAAPPQDLIKEQHSREVEIAKAKLNLLNNQYQQKQRDYQDLKAETLRVIQGTSRLNVDLLNSIVEETIAQIKELEQQVKMAEIELREMVSGAEQVRQDYTQLMNWAELFDKCSFESKKMIAAQFIKAVHVKRDYELDVEFNVAFDEFQQIYLEPEKESERTRGATTILALAEKSGQAV